jgi:hypothetical protein
MTCAVKVVPNTEKLVQPSDKDIGRAGLQPQETCEALPSASLGGAATTAKGMHHRCRISPEAMLADLVPEVPTGLLSETFAGYAAALPLMGSLVGCSSTRCTTICEPAHYSTQPKGSLPSSDEAAISIECRSGEPVTSQLAAWNRADSR